MNDVGGIKTRVRAFDAQHGKPIVLDETLLFPDGASRDIDPVGALIDPPTDPVQNAKAIAHFWETRLRYAREEFTKLKKHYTEHSEFAVAQVAVPEAVESLETAKTKLMALRDEVLLCQQKLKASQDTLIKLKAQNVTSDERERIQRFARNRNANQELLAAVRDIKI